MVHRNVQGFAPGGCKSLSCDAGRQRAAPAIICITNRGYSHVALTEIVCMDALFPPRIQALLRRATTLQKRPEGLRQRKISHSLILLSGSDMSHRDASVGMKFVGYSCWEVFFSPPQHGLRRSAQPDWVVSGHGHQFWFSWAQVWMSENEALTEMYLGTSNA